MSERAIREYHGKRMLSTWLTKDDQKSAYKALVPEVNGCVQINNDTNTEALLVDNEWLSGCKLVAKPDQLIKRRGKLGLVCLDATWDEATEWIQGRQGKEVHVPPAHGVLDTFIVEPFVPHAQAQELYVCIQSVRSGDEILFHHEGGVDVGDVDAKAKRWIVRTGSEPTVAQVTEHLLAAVSDPAQQQTAAVFICALWEFMASHFFTYLEVNPFVTLPSGSVAVLDMAAKVDQCAEFEVAELWGDDFSFPPPFGKQFLPEERHVMELDAKTGSSLKLTVLNPHGRIWTMVAGGGASVVYADSIVDSGGGGELANYGEYSGNPDHHLTFEYAKVILSLMEQSRPASDRKNGMALIIGGGIANFTNVAETFKGIIQALRKYKDMLRKRNVHIFVRRAGPNYQQGLQQMRDLGIELDIPIVVAGPEQHITGVVQPALECIGIHASVSASVQDFTPEAVQVLDAQVALKDAPNECPDTRFSATTKCIVWGMQPRAVQGMLDFDSACGRLTSSVCCIVYPFAGSHYLKFYYSPPKGEGQSTANSAEILLPVYDSLETAVSKHPEASVLINFASFRSVFSSVSDAFTYPSLKTIAIIAEGVPERYTKIMVAEAAKRDVLLIGPATVGGICPGSFRIGNTGGMLDNIIDARLYRKGSVAYVSKSGGMSNELNNILARHTDGTYEGIAIGGDRFPGSLFLDHLLRYEADPNVRLLVLLGEVGGLAEYDVANAIRDGRIKKPVVAWCMGTCAKVFPFEVQFGHAGSCARADLETADAKNAALREVGAFVPPSFDAFPDLIGALFKELKQRNVIEERVEPPKPEVPMDFAWAAKLGKVRKPTSFISTIADERGEELMYAGVPITNVLKENLGIGGVISLLWFRRRLPDYFSKWMELVLQICADHGPAVAGAHNTIVCARAGKDLISSLCSGLLTVGPRFGGALDEAASQFSEAYDRGLSPKQFVAEMRHKKKLIMGIGHRVKTIQNPDARVTLLKEFARSSFPFDTPVLDFALQVEAVTTAKKNNLILNVDGVVAVSFVDLVRNCGAFTREDARSYVHSGCLNGLFVLGRSIGLVGHFLDQNRLQQSLYRHPWDDISYFVQQDDLPH